MKSSPAVAKAALLVLLCLALVEGFVVTGGNAAAAPQTGQWNAPANLDSCFQTNRKMAVELLIDRTGSLIETDPSGQRVDFAQSIVSAFSSIAERDAGKIQVQATAFGVGTSPIIGFQPLTPQTAPSISNQLDQFRGMNHDQSTDYVTALGVAQADLATQAEAMSPETSGAGVCKVLVWLTDGQFDVMQSGLYVGWTTPPTVVNSSNSVDVEARGISRLCDPVVGSADALRSNGIFVFAVGLTSASSSPDFSLLSGIAGVDPIGGSGGRSQLTHSCGANRAQAEQTGAFYSGSVSDLVLQLISPLMATPPPPQESVSCSMSEPSCSWTFTTYPHTVGATFLLLPQGLGPMTLTSSTGLSFSLGSGQNQTSGGATVDVGVGKYPFVTMAFDGKTIPAGPISWTVAAQVTDPSASLGYTQPALDFGIRLVPVDRGMAWVRGKQSQSTFALRWLGQPLQTGVVAQSKLTGTVALGSGVPVSVPSLDDGNVVHVTYRVPAGDPSTQASVVVKGRLVLAPDEGGEKVSVSATSTPSITVSGVPLPAATVAFGLIHAASAKTVDHKHGLIGQPISKTAEVTVRGAVGDTGLFCFTKSTISPSHGPTGTVARACAVIPFGHSKVVPLTISFDRPYAGSLGGAFVDAYSALQSTPDVHTPFHIPITGIVQLPPIPTTTDQGTFWMLVILSFLLALAIWAGASLLAARLKDPETVSGWCGTVQIGPGSAGIEPFPRDPNKWKYLDRGTGRFALRTKFPGDDKYPLALSFRARIRLWALQDVIVSREDHVAYGSMGAVGRVGPSAALIAHKIQGEWVFTIPIGTEVPADGEAAVLEGELFFFIRDGAITSESDPSGVFASAQRGVSAGYPEIVRRLQKKKQADDTTPPDGETAVVIPPMR